MSAIYTSLRGAKGLMITSVIWLLTLATLFAVAGLRGFDWMAIAPYALWAALPAVLGMLLSPVLQREWAQIAIIFAWIALAIAACVTIGFWPMALLFLCAPAAAALFEREKIIEALVLSAIFTALIYFASTQGRLPIAGFGAAGDGGDITLWAKLSVMVGTGCFLMATLFAASQTVARAAAPVAQSTIPANRGATDIAMLDALSGGIVRLNSDDEITFVSMDAYDIFDLPEDSGNLTSHALLAGRDLQRARVLDIIDRARSSNMPETVTLSLTGGANGPPPNVFDLRATPLTDGEIVLHATDVSEREERLTALNSEWVAAHQTIADTRQIMDDKTLFFSGVSHELRTPLNAIIGFSDMMRSRLFGPLPSKYAEYAELIHDSGQHMLDLIGDVLDMSKIEAGKYSLLYGVFDMGDVIRSSVKMVRPAADAAELAIQIDIASDQDLLIEADRKAVRQILLNLLSNAIKFTPKGGQVTISGKAVGDTFHLSVNDNGVGMSADELSTIGQPYVQSASGQNSDHRGSGLGLSLVKSLTDLHGGRFAIASQKDSGTSVDIYLPLARDEANSV